MTLSSSMEYPPGPHSILPEKLLREFMNDPIKTLMNIAHTYGNIAHFKLGRRHVYQINEPSYIEDVLIRNHKNYKAVTIFLDQTLILSLLNLLSKILLLAPCDGIHSRQQQNQAMIK